MKDLSFEIIGDILIIREKANKKKLREFAKEKMNKHTYIKTVVIQTSKIKGQERKRNLQFLLGERTFFTTYKEYGNSFYVNLKKAFFSPRLSFERQRISRLVKEEEKILNFFSGVGPFDIAIASKLDRVEIHSIEINKFAYQYLCRNIELNKCQDKINPYFGDAFDIVPKKFYNQFDRILLPLPMEANRALPLAFNSLNNQKGTIHWQITEKIHSEVVLEEIVKERLEKITPRKIFKEASVNTMKIIRWLAPRIAHIAVDLDFF
jgi:tRNA (guanine37-N1)-methyltransferase